MRVCHIHGFRVVETETLPDSLPPEGFLWVALGRREFELAQADLQERLQAWTHGPLVDLHVSDLLNNQLPSHYDYTGQYDILVFRRLAQGQSETDLQAPGRVLHRRQQKGGPPVLHRIDTSPVGFAVFDRVLITVHPASCAVRDSYAGRLQALSDGYTRAMARAGADGPAQREALQGASRTIPTSPADLMLRLVSHMVDGYLDLRRELTRQLDHWQAELLNPNTRFSNWGSLLDARLSLHQLDEICEDQRAAVQDWIEALNTWPEDDPLLGARGLELLKVRSRDVLEHIERVIHHVRRLEASAEAAVQMHFSAQSHRANDIMRVLTVLTAIFLPLNLIAGIFGMNFDFIPLLHEQSGFWLTMGGMLAVALGLSLFFWRKRYLAQSR
ncbi:MAG: Magnesium transport protein CorA [Pseudomonadota bacterium]